MMKRLLVLLVPIFLASNLFSQIKAGQFLISVDGSYVKTTTENGVSKNQNVTDGKYLDIGTSLGYFISNRLIVGCGLDYKWEKEDRANQLMINRYYQAETMNVKSKVALPNVFLGYYYPVTSKLLMNANLKFSYGKMKSDYRTFWAGNVYYPSGSTVELTDDYSSAYAMSQDGNSKVDFFSVDLLPELSYFISSRFSFFLGLGGVSYSLLDWDTDHSGWVISFNPDDWTLGLKVKL